MSINIAGYLRISVDIEKDTDSTSIENQRDIITRWVADNFRDYNLDFYEDRDKSGYTFKEREQYQIMRPHLMNGDYNILIVKDFSRFSRRNSLGLLELETLRDAGVRIISIGDAIDYPTKDEWMMIQFKFLMNEMPVTDASKKVKSVIDSRQKKGEWICAVPYGYYITNTKTMAYTVDEKAVPVIKEIFNLYLDGWGYKKISNYLTEKKIPTPRMIEKERKDEQRARDGERPTKIKTSNFWAVPTIKEILVNDFYIGTLRQRKYTRARINGADKRVDEAEQRVFENKHEPIIDVKTFAKVQEQMKLRTKANYRGQKKYDTDYSGFLFCGDCGSPMFSRSSPRLAPQYICGAYHKRGTDKTLGGCSSHQIRVDLLDTMIKKYIERVMANSETMIAELEKAIKEEPKNTREDTSSLETMELELARAREELKDSTRFRNRDIERAEKRFSAETLEKEIDRIYERYDAIEDELRVKIDGLENQIKILADKRNNRIQINRIAKTSLDIFREILNKDKLDKNDLALIVDRISVFDDGNIEVQLKADISMLLETGNISDEILKASSFVGNAVNFNWDTKDILNSQLVQKAINQKDKVFSVNVLCEGDPLEIYTGVGGEVIFKKYSPIGELSDFASQYAESLSRATSLPVIICDRDHCVAAGGLSKKEVLERRITPPLEDIMEQRRSVTYSSGEDYQALEGVKRGIRVGVPIINAGDVSGAVVLVEDGNGTNATETDIKLTSVAADFLGKQME